MLKWESANCGECWFAYSAVPPDPDYGCDENLAWQLDRDAYGEEWWPGNTPERLTGITEVAEKPTWLVLEHGQAWCQAREDALLAAMATETGGPQP